MLNYVPHALNAKLCLCTGLCALPAFADSCLTYEPYLHALRILFVLLEFFKVEFLVHQNVSIFSELLKALQTTLFYAD